MFEGARNALSSVLRGVGAILGKPFRAVLASLALLDLLMYRCHIEKNFL